MTVAAREPSLRYCRRLSISDELGARRNMNPKPAVSFALPDAVAVSGASSGLGKSICRLLAEHGVHTVGVDLSPAADETKKLASYVHVTGDVGQEETWLEALKTSKT